MNDAVLPLAVIALPAIAPLIALIQLLFPGLLGEHWKEYRAAIAALLSQSSLMFVQWLLTFWIAADASWWLGPAALAWGMAAISGVGLLVSLATPRIAGNSPPAKIEFLALAGLALASAVWLAWQWFSGASLLDQMLVIAAACVAGLAHLLQRQRWAQINRCAAFATQTVFLLVLTASGVAVAHYGFREVTSSGMMPEIAGDVPTFRYDSKRTGSSDSSHRGPQVPHVFATPYAPIVGAGLLLLESSPVVVNDALFLGARHQIQATAGGVVMGVAINSSGEEPTFREAWRFGDHTTRAVFSSPALHEGLLYFGEGYHQHQKCRLFCLDARTGKMKWSFRTASHVESPPTIADGSIYFGAGDDGLYALTLAAEQPTLAWHVPGIHVDSSPLVANGKVFAGGVVGDRVAKLAVMAVDAKSGQPVWTVPSDLPVPSAPALDGAAILVGLGNGKLNAEHERPSGAVWRINTTTGERLWEFPLDASVLSSPIASEGRVYFVARNGDCYGLEGASGQRLWKHSLGDDVLNSPVVSGGRMIVVTAQGSIVCLDCKTGDELWRLDDLRQSTSLVLASPALVDGQLYAAIGGKVYVVGEAKQP